MLEMQTNAKLLSVSLSCSIINKHCLVSYREHTYRVFETSTERVIDQFHLIIGYEIRTASYISNVSVY